MTVLSLCTEDECGFQSLTSIEERVAAALVTATGPVAVAAEAVTAATTAAAAAPAGAAGVAAITAGATAAGAALAPAAVLTAVAAGSFFAVKYIKDRLNWTSKAKRREFKRQFIAHVTKKRRLIVNSTSANCSHQVQQ